MACAEADEDFKLPLRPWLEKQINSGKFRGLEWEEFEGDNKLFRLPWVKKNLPDWEEYYKIFRAWADHRGRGESERLEDSKLKSNFRCALNKSVDFEEVSSRSQLHRQTGNYKVYRILTPKEVRDKKKRRSKVQAKQEHNFNNDELKTIDKKGLDVLDSLGSTSCVPVASLDICDTSMDFTQLVTGDSTLNSQHTYLLSQSEVNCDQLTTVRPPEIDQLSPSLAISPAPPSVVQAVWPQDVPMEEEEEVQIGPSPPLSDNRLTENLSYGNAITRALILQQLENAGIKKERLCECQVIITYNDEKVLDRDISDMDKGYRIFYGDKEKQIRFLQMRNTTDEKLADFKLKDIQLPPLEQRSHTMSAILDKTDLGIVVRYDPQSLQLCVKRLCQSQVFFFDPHDESTKLEPQKLEREEIVGLFSYEKYFVDFFERYITTPNANPPEAEIFLAVGIKPKSKVIRKGLKIELIPFALKFFAQHYKEPGGSISLCFSNPTSMENLLRTIHRNYSPSKVSNQNFT